MTYNKEKLNINNQENDIFEKKINELEQKTKLFVAALVGFDKDNSTNYIKIRDVNEKCEELKRLVLNLLNKTGISTAEKFKIGTVTATAEMYISIYETAQFSGKPLHGNILYMDLKI